MAKLTAEFEFELPSIILLRYPDHKDAHFSSVPIPSFDFSVDGFDVEVEFINARWNIKKPDEIPISHTNSIKLRVSRDDSKYGLLEDSNKINGHLKLSKYLLGKCLDSYSAIAKQIMRNLALFFTYQLSHLPFEELKDGYFLNPTWYNSKDEQINIGVIQAVANYDTIQHELFIPLSSETEERFVKALQSPSSYELYDELLAQARDAIVRSNLRRAVLEMAIACEIFVKSSYFPKSTPASVAFDEMHPRPKVLDLIHKTAKRAIGKSFCEDKKSHYNNIKNLFECRNKVAHHGELFFYDNSVKHLVDKAQVLSWYDSVNELIKWVNESGLRNTTDN